MDSTVDLKRPLDSQLYFSELITRKSFKRFPEMQITSRSLRHTHTKHIYYNFFIIFGNSNMAASAAPKSTPEIITRTTKGGRKLKYTLTVIQQPERARACGSGAKSSADRRPVDPPPVVQLRIHDETEPRQEKEITFHYNANFFLFATLEYKLSFNLYEETKEEKDADIESVNESSMRKMSSAAAAAESSFDWRMELKSDQFTVYSAKKFPGLSESTDLSRTVAEQGCRVRIRRDVRMRRRDNKPGGDFGENEDEYSQRGRATSPSFDYNSQAARQRGLSVGGNEDPQQRRGSGEISPYHSPAGSPYHTPSVSPSTPNAPPPTGGQLNWIAQGGYAPVQAIQPPPPPPPPHSSLYPQPVPASYTNPGSSTPFRQQPPKVRLRLPQEVTMSFGYQVSNAPQGPQPIAPAAQSTTYSQQPMESSYSRNPPTSAYANHYHDSVALAPLRPEQQPIAMSPLAPVKSISRGPPTLAPAPNSMPNHNYNKLERYGSYSQYPPPEVEPARPANKRSFGDTFSTPHEPLHNGRRPSAISQDDEDEHAENQKSKESMTYKRANGEFQQKPAPQLS
ncbi:hypothetical protein DID88_006262 [Monilinia fructigena]|uniref:Velvet domain-containing protein n=1 Tax=Monilinia fructigena TaxID=38457 RepID=A0A395J269_9HELO|nr:hypothetical protein DID88_006262 [Monilinia fructigena]